MTVARKDAARRPFEGKSMKLVKPSVAFVSTTPFMTLNNDFAGSEEMEVAFAVQVANGANTDSSKLQQEKQNKDDKQATSNSN